MEGVEWLKRAKTAGDVAGVDTVRYINEALAIVTAQLADPDAVGTNMRRLAKEDGLLGVEMVASVILGVAVAALKDVAELRDEPPEQVWARIATTIGGHIAQIEVEGEA